MRSSFYLEDVATEFHVQGLELDWACVVWDGDFRYAPEWWRHHSYKRRGCASTRSSRGPRSQHLAVLHEAALVGNVVVQLHGLRIGFVGEPPHA